LGVGGEEELVAGAAWSSQAQAVEFEDALQCANSISFFFRSRRETR
jgi:hypothetical protein